MNCSQKRILWAWLVGSLRNCSQVATYLRVESHRVFTSSFCDRLRVDVPDPTMPLFKWSRTSSNQIASLEDNIFSCLNKKPEGQYVSLDNDPNKQIWTITMNPEKTSNDNLPLVMLHGMGAGVGLWLRNLEQLSSNRVVHAFDLPGFGRSFRQRLSGKVSAEMAEDKFVESIESWRKSMKLEKFFLLGHSLGGYLASAYALKHPEHVKGLVLVDSWGFPHKVSKEKLPQLSMTARTILFLYRTLNPNPLALLRAAGPWGPSMITKFRPDLIHKFSHENMKDDTVIADYVYHCNAQEPSGETAFKCLVEGIGWAQNPMIDRIGNISTDIPIMMIHGEDSWVDSSICEEVQNIRAKSVVNVEIIKNAGHHVYVDQPETFNELVKAACLQFEGKKTASLKKDRNNDDDTLAETVMDYIM